eukprot:TRINITY_DN52667_c0_g1_i1.p1 TRINITY_DN52667_c0_g1~~TRINITY_DN52667_c0_g1_i1.p1  ORF type:complete len:229 (+),score=25.07 TRINITY_DN52667_c0_g1_i1:29-688(+)
MGASCSVKPKPEGYDSHRTLMTEIPTPELLDLVTDTEASKPAEMRFSAWLALSSFLLTMCALVVTLYFYVNAESSQQEATCFVTALLARKGEDESSPSVLCDYAGITSRTGKDVWTLSSHEQGQRCKYFGASCDYHRPKDCRAACFVTKGGDGSVVVDFDGRGSNPIRDLLFNCLVFESALLLVTLFLFFLFRQFPGIETSCYTDSEVRPDAAMRQYAF